MRFHQYWSSWETKLEKIVRDHSARLSFPALKGPARSGDEDVYSIDEPLVIFNAPQKGSSGRARRNTIFVDGSFTFGVGAQSSVLKCASSSVTIYDIRIGDAGIEAKLFDALHFDIERPDRQTPYHPIFHVQRGRSNQLTDDVVRKSLASFTRENVERIQLSGEHPPGSPYLRLPSPQLDPFSVLVLLMADFFFNPNDTTPKTEALFCGLLDALCDDRNVARVGESSDHLFQRSARRGWSSSAHWYKECA